MRISVISDHFKGIRLTRRVDIVSNAILDFSTTQLIDYDLIINPLTFNEVKYGLKEIDSTKSVIKSGKDLVAHP